MIRKYLSSFPKKVSISAVALFATLALYAGTASITVTPATFTNLLAQNPNLGSVVVRGITVAARWLVDKEKVEWCLDYKSSEDLVAAQTCLGNIQQKKLFDKQCQWRAETFTHPAIETTSDFNYWEKNILNCPFIDPITEEDVALYIEFLQEYLGEDLTFLGRWQDYNSYNSSVATVAKLMNKQKDEDEDDDDDDDYR